MGRPRGTSDLSPVAIQAIVRGRASGTPQIALAAQFNVSPSTISKLLQRYKQQGVIKKASRGNRPRMTSRVTDRNIVRLSRDNPRLTVSDIQSEVKSPAEPTPSVRTIRRRLQAAGLNGRTPVKKPLISEKNRRRRLAWCKSHLNWSVAQWRRVIWSDESKYNLFGSDGKVYVRRRVGCRFLPKYQLPTVKHGGGNVMVHGLFSEEGVGPLQRVVGIMDRFGYEALLKNALPWIKAKHGRNYIFQQDNDPKHTSNHIKDYFRNKRWVMMDDWPSQSPDLNPIEHLWEELERRVKNKRAKNADEKFKKLEAEWHAIPKQTLLNLIDSMPRRCQAVIDAKGYATKY